MSAVRSRLPLPSGSGRQDDLPWYRSRREWRKPVGRCEMQRKQLFIRGWPAVHQSVCV